MPTSAENTSKDELRSDGEQVEDSDYDTDLEFEEPREEYDPTGKMNILKNKQTDKQIKSLNNFLLSSL